MLSLKTVKSVDYYTRIKDANHGIEYYFPDQKNNVSFWFGKLADKLGLTNLSVKKEDIIKVRQMADTKKKIVRYGEDLTFSAPKSVSIAYMMLGDNRILEAHHKAVKKTLEIVEKEYILTKDKGKKEKAEGIAVSCFTHFLSRALDPQLHTHCIINSSVLRKDGKIRSLQNELIYKNRMAIGKTYIDFLKEEIKKLGYEIEDKLEGYQFEIKGIDQDLIDLFSKRRRQIVSKLQEIINSKPENRQKVKELIKQPNKRLKRWFFKLEDRVVILTRKRKDFRPMADIYKNWLDQIEKYKKYKIQRSQNYDSSPRI